MLKFYHNPKTGDLIIFDQTDSEVFILEPIRSVRVVTAKDVSVGDLRREELIAKSPVKEKKEKKPTRTRTKITPAMEREIEIKSSLDFSVAEIAKFIGISYAAADRRVKEIKKQKQKQNGGGIGQNSNIEDQERGNGSI